MARRHLIAIIPDRGQEYIGWGKTTKRYPNHIAKRVSNEDGSISWKRAGWKGDYDVIQDPHNPRQILVYWLRHIEPKSKPETSEVQRPTLVAELFEQFSVRTET
jgi:hypothetical protein